MKNMRILLAIWCVVFAFAITACGGSKDDSKNNMKETDEIIAADSGNDTTTGDISSTTSDGQTTTGEDGQKINDCSNNEPTEENQIVDSDSQSESTSNTQTPPIIPIPEAHHQINVFVSEGVKVMQIMLETSNNQILQFVKDGTEIETSIPISADLWLIWNGDKAGWFPGWGIKVPLLLPTTTIEIPDNDTGTLSIYDAASGDLFWISIGNVVGNGITVDNVNYKISFD